MSALTGVPGADGRIAQTVGAPVFYWRGMPFDAADDLCIVNDTRVPPLSFNGTVFVDSNGKVAVTTGGAISFYLAGLPFDAVGNLCVELAAPATFSQGVGITAAGRVAII